MPRVSVVVPFLNMEKFLAEAIESVFAQTYGDWELLLVDDGADDGSTGCAQRYAWRYPDRAKYLQHPGHENRGASAARNLGLRNATGEYVAFLDADDVWLPGKLDRQVEILGRVPEAGMIYGATEYWYSWTGKPGDIARDAVRDLGVEGNTVLWPPTLLTLFLRGAAPTPSCSNVMVRRTVVNRVGGFDDTFRRVYTDQVFWAKVCLATPVFVSTECWDRYRQRTDSSYSGVRGTAIREQARAAYLAWLEQYLTAHGVESAEVWKALREKQARHQHSGAQNVIDRAWRSARAVFKHGR